MPIFQKDGKSVLFIHLPKNGGSSIENAFKASGYAASYLDGKVGAGTLNDLRRCTPQHMHAKMLRANFKLYRFDAIFLIVRDPIARFSSEYLWRNGNSTKDVSAEAVEKWGLSSFRRYTHDRFLFDNHIRPQHEFLVDRADIFRFEDGLENAIQRLNDRYKLGVTTDLPRVRDGRDVSGFSSRDVHISQRMESAIRAFYRRDFSRFGYGRGATSARSFVEFGGPEAFARRVARKVRR